LGLLTVFEQLGFAFSDLARKFGSFGRLGGEKFRFKPTYCFQSYDLSHSAIMRVKKTIYSV
jgi:hypothetical protein